MADAIANLNTFAEVAAPGRDDVDRLALAEIAWRRDLLGRISS